MVCYCPLSVLSVPESILNEGQLHLAAIFQLSSRCHGDPVVSREPARKARGTQVEGEQILQGVGVSGWRVKGRPGPGPGERDRRKNSTESFGHALLTPDKSAISKTPSIFQWPHAADSPP